MGSVAKRPDGRWRARYRGPDNRERSAHFDRKHDAELWLARQVTRLSDGSWVDPDSGRRLFADYARGWLTAQIHHRPSTTSITKTRLEGHLIPHFGDRTLVSIQRTDVQAWVSKLSETLSPSYVHGLYRLMAQIMLAAVEDRVLSHTPCRKVRLPSLDGSAMVIPTSEQVAAVVAAAPAVARPLILTAAATGMRSSEVCGLTLDRVDFLRRTVTVDRQLVGTNHSSARFGPPKTKASVRTIPVPQQTIDAISSVTTPDSTFVFLTPSGHPWVRRSLSESWRAWTAKAKVSFRFHDLRHYYASALIASGQSVKVIQERLGHGSAAITLDTYGHLWPADEDATREAISGLLAEISRTQRGLAP